MNYEKNYYDYANYVKSLVEKGIRPKIRSEETHNKNWEFHHIIPKWKGGDDSPNNVIPLTYREHFLAHFLLWKFDPHPKNALAFHFMHYNQSSKRFNNSKYYEKLRQEFGKLNSEIHGRPYELRYGEKAQSIRKKISKSNKDRYIRGEHIISDYIKNSKGKTYEEIHGIEKAKHIRKKLVSSHTGYIQSEEQKQKRSKSLKGHPYWGPPGGTEEWRSHIFKKGQVPWNKGVPMTEDQKEKAREYSKKVHCYNNGLEQRRFYDERVPDGWKLGTLKSLLEWYNNGIENQQYVPLLVPEGWVKGRLELRGKYKRSKFETSL